MPEPKLKNQNSVKANDLDANKSSSFIDNVNKTDQEKILVKVPHDSNSLATSLLLGFLGKERFNYKKFISEVNKIFLHDEIKDYKKIYDIVKNFNDLENQEQFKPIVALFIKHLVNYIRHNWTIPSFEKSIDDELQNKIHTSKQQIKQLENYLKLLTNDIDKESAIQQLQNNQINLDYCQKLLESNSEEKILSYLAKFEKVEDLGTSIQLNAALNFLNSKINIFDQSAKTPLTFNLEDKFSDSEINLQLDNNYFNCYLSTIEQIQAEKLNRIIAINNALQEDSTQDDSKNLEYFHEEKSLLLQEFEETDHQFALELKKSELKHLNFTDHQFADFLGNEEQEYWCE